MPNSKKNRPTIPFMKAIGTNTAMIENVVAITASPISDVPKRAASMWLLPNCMCRTMFSRTTIASSISRPTESDSPMSVRMFSEKPMIFMMMKAEMIDTGSVSPVITVLRQLLRNRKTMNTVKSAPSTSVYLHILDRVADELRGIPDDIQARLARQFPVQDRQLSLDGFRHIDRVAARLLAHLQRQASLPVDQRQRALLFVSVRHPRDLAQVDRNSANCFYDEILKQVRVVNLPFHAHQFLDGAALDLSGRDLDVFAPESHDHFGNRQAVGLHALRIQKDLNFTPLPADDLERADTFDVLEALFDDLLRQRT